jgi:cysteine desulfurase/selenocysteine lyase
MTPDGRLDLDALATELTSRCRLVALTHCSNVTGAMTNVAKVVAAARSVGAKVLLDGAQRAPHGPVDVQEMGVDFYAFSGHKTYGPTGIGILWARSEILEAMPPFLTGGQMIDEVTLTSATFREPPRRFEAGTPPIAGAIGLGAAFDWMMKLDWNAIQKHDLGVTRRILAGLSAMKGVWIIGPRDTNDRRGVISFSVEGFSAEEICSALDAKGVALRGGYHCAQPLVHAFGVDGAARASLAPYTLNADVDALLEGMEDLVRTRTANAGSKHRKNAIAGAK